MRQKLTTSQVKAMAVKKQSLPITGGIVGKEIAAGFQSTVDFSGLLKIGFVGLGGLLALVALLSM